MLSAAVQPRTRPVTTTRRSLLPVAAVLFGHAVLGVLMTRYGAIATAHALVTLLVAVAVAALTPWTEHIAYAAAYVTGAELLWRISDAAVFHEVGKYAVILILGIGLLRLGGRQRIVLPLAYLAVLLPSIVLTIDRLGLAGTRQEVSFNLSGPAALAVSVLFFGRLQTTWATIRHLLWTLIAPIVGIAAAAAEGARTAGPITFANSSNFVTSAGFGPNQVSALLGLGALAGLVLAVQEEGLGRRILASVVALWLLAQGALTFSRGGVVNVAVALLIALAYSLREPRRLAAFVLPVVAVTLFSGFVVYPRLVDFTGGAIETRFTGVKLDERSSLLQTDLRIFADHPVLGVGPGVSKQSRRLADGRTISAHTEFTRLLAEHGLAGAIAVVLLLAMVIESYRRAPNRPERAWVLVLAGWSLSEMSHGAMRFAAVSFVFGLMACRIVPAGSSAGESATDARRS